MYYLWCSWVMPNDSKHIEASFFTDFHGFVVLTIADAGQLYPMRMRAGCCGDGRSTMVQWAPAPSSYARGMCYAIAAC